ncbi:MULTISPECIES: hypothetical protein [Micromonospora]|uniref:TSCPD domain-containing protein n=1 Tax=Micromonospora TaxID=1873 RepID=UPI0033CA7207
MNDGSTHGRASRRHAGITVDFVLGGTPGCLLTAGSDGRLAYVDLRVGKHGSTLAGLTEALSTAITTSLQAGAPLPELVVELRNTHYVPAGATTDPDVPQATSLSDYLAHRLQPWTPEPGNPALERIVATPKHHSR